MVSAPLFYPESRKVIHGSVLPKVEAGIRFTSSDLQERHRPKIVNVLAEGRMFLQPFSTHKI